MTTGQRIKAARKKAGLTQKALGEKLGIAYQTLAQWENDLRNPKYETLKRIADALCISVYDLIEPPFEPCSTGGRIEKCRVDAGLTQQDLAERCGLMLTDIRKYEAGTVRPAYETVVKIAGVLGVTPDYLSGRTLKRNLVAFPITINGKPTTCGLLNVAFSRLNDVGQQKALERVAELAEIPRYQNQEKPSEDPQEPTERKNKPPEED